MIVDAHAHIFPEIRGAVAAGSTQGHGYGRIAIGDQVMQALPPCGERIEFTPEMLVGHMEWAGVDKAVLLQGPFYGECNEYVRQALARYPERFIGAAYFDPWAPHSRDILAQVCAEGDFRAVKIEFSVTTGLCGLHPGARFDDPTLAWVWDELEQYGLVLVLDLGAVGTQSYQTGAVGAIAEEHPQLKIVITHLAQPTPPLDNELNLCDLWLEQVDLASLANVWLDTAALPAYFSEEDFPFPGAGRYLRQALERVGPQKIMWGTDLPGLLVHATYPQLLRFAELHTQFLSAGERALILGENALDVFGP